MNHAQIMFEYIANFVDELVQQGVRSVVISPGSRSTPLAMIVHEHPDMDVWVQIDERSASFFALGLAKVKQQPVVLLCSSGSATANYYPAIIEASMARVPIIVLTADRPHELRGVGAPQTVDQIKMFGDHVRLFVEMSVPEPTKQLISYVRVTAARSASVSMQAPRGPVHLNFPFREPLVPEIPMDINAWLETRKRSDSVHPITVYQGILQLPLPALEQILATIMISSKALIICGPQEDEHFARAVTELAARLNLPIFADPLSQVRCGNHDLDHVIDSYDVLLRSKHVQTHMQPDLILRFGAMPISKSLAGFISKWDQTRSMIVDERGGWRDPSLTATEMVYAHPTQLCIDLLELIDAQKDGTLADLSFDQTNANEEQWLSRWMQMSRLARQQLEDHSSKQPFFEGRVFVELASLLPDPCILFAGNSMPVRDLDAFFRSSAYRIHIAANRGANGIDGVVSSAVGHAAGSMIPLVLIIGDLSFYHDLNGLLATRKRALNLTIVVINNDGGGIFSFLPQAKQGHSERFEALFGTPTGLDFTSVVHMYDGDFIKVNTWQEFRKHVQHGINSQGLSVIQIDTNRQSNVLLHRRLFEQVQDTIDKEFA